MNMVINGGLTGRRWGRLVAVPVIAMALAACATTPREDRATPPEKCSKARARPANPHGSVLVPASAQASPAANDRDVMLFGNGATAPAPEAAPPSATVPAIEQQAAPGRKVSFAPSASGRLARSVAQSDEGSC